MIQHEANVYVAGDDGVYCPKCGSSEVMFDEICCYGCCDDYHCVACGYEFRVQC